MNIEVNKVKIFVTVPSDYTQKVRDAVCEAGAGGIGNYSFCTTCTKTKGTFIPNENSNPFIGAKNKLEVVLEDKLEFVCDIDKVKCVISKLRQTHPYEEPAIDIVPILDEKMFQ